MLCFMEPMIDHIGTVTAQEIVHALGLPPRTFEQFRRVGIIPEAVIPPSRGILARYPISTFSALAITAKLSPFTGGIYDAARIALAINPDLVTLYGSIPFGFEDMQRELVTHGLDPDKARTPAGELCPLRVTELLWLTGQLDEHKPRDADFLLVLIDGELVASGKWRGLQYLVHNVAKPLAVQPELRIRRTGETVTVQPIEVDAGEVEFASRMERADNILQINLGLAMRRALIEVIKLRGGRT